MSLPDLDRITSPAQFFTSNYTLPQIRQIHKSIHDAIEDRSARLRTQVGAGYRELLGTAETIVRMHDDTDKAIDILTHVGSRCSRSAVGSKVGNLAKLRVSQEADADAKVGLAARARLLEGCSLAAQVHLRPTGNPSSPQRQRPTTNNLVVVAKILVLGRLLAKSFSDSPPGPQVELVVNAAWKRLASHRRRLLGAVKDVLSDSDENLSRADILKALGAYSLATSGGAKDILWHFLRVRGEAMALCFDTSERERERCTAEDVERCLRLYTRTMVDVQKLVPGKVGDALRRLAQTAIMADEGMRNVEGLRLDVYEKWCGDEIRYFTPYIQHNDLAGDQARAMLTGWSKEGAQVVLAGLSKTLQQIPEFKSIAQLRSTVLQLWIQEGGKARGFDPSVMLGSLREVINEHILIILDGKVGKLRLVGSEISATLDSWTEGVTDQTDSLWETDTLDMDMVNGASALIQEVMSRENGRSAAVSKALTCYASWALVIDEVSDVINKLKKTRWESDFDEIEDEETIETRVRLLNKVDPEILEDKLRETLISTFKELSKTIQDLWNSKKDSPNAGHISMYFLRVLRDIRSHLPPQLDKTNDFGLEMIPSLHETLVRTVIIYPLDEIVTGGLNKRACMGRALWEGDPELPTWPSPWAFMFLRNMSHSMEDAGIDLWTAHSLQLLKDTLNAQLAHAWAGALAQVVDLKDAEENVKEETKQMPKAPSREKGEQEDTDDDTDDDDKDSSDDESSNEGVEDKEAAAVGYEGDGGRELFTQWFFDVSMIRCCLGSPSRSEDDGLEALQEAIYQKTGLESADSRQRIVKASQEYWKKTGLLFSLVEGPQKS